MDTVTIRVKNMICRQCEQSLALGLAKQRGVLKVAASYSTATVSVSYDPTRCSRDEISETLDKIGYPEGEGITGKALDALSIVFAVLIFTLLQALPLPMAPRANSGAPLVQLLFIGLFTSIHCVAMCGGIMLVQTAPANGARSARHCACDETKTSRRQGEKAAFEYNLGRVCSYALMGAICGTIGGSLTYSAGARCSIFTVAGALVVLAGCKMLGIVAPIHLRLPQIPLRTRQRIRAGATRLIPAKPLAVGLLTGIMPCGALASMWMVAAASGSGVAGAACMLAFCLGTLPLMLAFALFGHLLPASWSKHFLRVSSILVIALGLSLAQKGLVAIPMLL